MSLSVGADLLPVSLSLHGHAPEGAPAPVELTQASPAPSRGWLAAGWTWPQDGPEHRQARDLLQHNPVLSGIRFIGFPLTTSFKAEKL